jgi:hypothetical protein
VLFPEKVTLVSVGLEEELYIIPPAPVVLLPEKVTLVRTGLLSKLLITLAIALSLQQLLLSEIVTSINTGLLR